MRSAIRQRILSQFVHQLARAAEAGMLSAPVHAERGCAPSGYPFDCVGWAPQRFTVRAVLTG